MGISPVNIILPTLPPRPQKKKLTNPIAAAAIVKCPQTKTVIVSKSLVPPTINRTRVVSAPTTPGRVTRHRDGSAYTQWPQAIASAESTLRHCSRPLPLRMNATFDSECTPCKFARWRRLHAPSQKFNSPPFSRSSKKNTRGAASWACFCSKCRHIAHHAPAQAFVATTAKG